MDSRPIFAPAAPPADCDDEGIAVLAAELLGELSCDESGIEGAVQRLQAQQATAASLTEVERVSGSTLDIERIHKMSVAR